MNARQKFFQALKEYRYSEAFARTEMAGAAITEDVVQLFQIFEAAEKLPPPMKEEVEEFRHVNRLTAARAYKARNNLIGERISAICLVLAEGVEETEHDVPTLRMGDVR